MCVIGDGDGIVFLTNCQPLEQQLNRRLERSMDKFNLDDTFLGFPVSPGGDGDNDATSPSPGENPWLSDSDNHPSSTDEDQELSAPPSPDVPQAGENELREGIFGTLTAGNNLLIEMPPGTNRQAKVVSELIHVYQWVNNGMKHPDAVNLDNSSVGNFSKIIVGVRNLEEGDRLLKSLKSELLVGVTNLLWKFKICVNGDQKDFCINQDVIRGKQGRAAVSHACRCLVPSVSRRIPSPPKKTREDVLCNYYERSQQLGGSLPFVFTSEQNLGISHHEISDIEDFKLTCRQAGRCPYEDAKILAEDPDVNLIIVPMEKLFAMEFQDNLNNAIVYIDDGFNIENVCKRLLSVNLRDNELLQFADLLSSIKSKYETEADATGLDHLTQFLLQLAEWVASTLHFRQRPEQEDILDQIKALNRNREVLHVASILEIIQDYGETYANAISSETAEVLEKLCKFILVVDNLLQKTSSFNVKLPTEECPKLNSNRQYIVLQIVCANPAIIMQPVESTARSLIIGSSCIAPYSPFYYPDSDIGLGVTFHKTLKLNVNPSVGNRIQFLCATHGDSGKEFVVNYNERDNRIIKQELGTSLLQLCQVVKNGKLALFHSEDYLRKLIQFWKAPVPDGNTLFERLQEVCPVFCELWMTTDEEISVEMANFEKASKAEKGAVLLLLQRGNLYQDWDLKYNSVRGIFHLSIPYGPWYTNPDIIAKRRFIEAVRQERDCVDNKDWYHREAFRVLNQSYSCCIQDASIDWGIVVVMDNRMCSEKHEFPDRLPDWLRKSSVGGPKYFKDFHTLTRSIQSRITQLELGWI